MYGESRVPCTHSGAITEPSLPTATAEAETARLCDNHQAGHSNNDYTESHERYCHGLVPHGGSIQLGEESHRLAEATIDEIGIRIARGALIVARSMAQLARVVAPEARQSGSSGAWDRNGLQGRVSARRTAVHAGIPRGVLREGALWRRKRRARNAEECY